MKKPLLLLMLCALFATTYNVQAQDNSNDDIKTVFGDDITFGGFGGYCMKMSPVNEDLGLFVGGRGGFIINHQFSLGGGGYGLTTNSRFNDSFNLGMGYGGLVMEYTLLSNKAIHLSVPVMFAGGAANISYETEYDNDQFKGYTYQKNYESSSIFVLEPGVDIELNILKFFRIGFGASYRMVAGSHLLLLNDKDLSNAAFNMTFKFGYF